MKIELELPDFTDTHFEKVVLEILMRYGIDAYKDVVDILKPEHFASGSSQELYRAIQKRFTESTFIDRRILAQEIGDTVNLTLSNLIEMSDMPAVNRPALTEYAQELIRLATKRDLRDRLIEDLKAITDNSDADPEHLVNIVQASFDGLDSIEETHIKDAMPEAMAFIASLKNKEEMAPIVPTGFTELDSTINGGLFPGTLNIIGARPGDGKSALGTNILINILRNVYTMGSHKPPMLMFSLEMNAQQVIQRIMSSFSGMSGSEFRTAKEIGADKTELMTRQTIECFAHKGDPVPRLLICDKSFLTPEDITAIVTGVARRYGGLSCVMLDYLQLVTVNTKNQTRAAALGDVSRILKEIARQYNIPVIAQCQLKREASQKPKAFQGNGNADMPPQNSDIKDSGSIEQDADLILMIRRTINSNITRIDGTERRTIYVTKNRNGASGENVTTELVFNGRACRFQSVYGEWRENVNYNDAGASEC